jgi:5'-nucleotidase
MVQEYTKSITIGISTSALFDMEQAKKLREKYGPDFYTQYMIDREDEPLKPGYFFDVIKTMQDINKELGHPIFDFVLLSTNTAWTGIRAVKSANHYGIGFSSAMFGNGPLDPEYMNAYDINWFITTNEDDAQNAQNLGIASCTVDPKALKADPNREIQRILNGRIPKKLEKRMIKPQELEESRLQNQFNRKLHVVWDLDRVIFDGASDDVYGKHGLDKYREYELNNAGQTLNDGPFAPIAQILGGISSHFAEGHSPIRSSVITARGDEATLRALHSLRDKGIRFDGELHFMGGKDKDRVLKIMDKDEHSTLVFLDDSDRTIDMTKGLVTSGLVPKASGAFSIGDEKKKTAAKTKTPKPKRA